MASDPSRPQNPWGGLLMVVGVIGVVAMMLRGGVGGFYAIFDDHSIFWFGVVSIVLTVFGYWLLNPSGGQDAGEVVPTSAELAGIKEWPGTDIEAVLDPSSSPLWDMVLESSPEPNHWAKLSLGPGADGQLRLVALVWDQPVAFMTSTELPNHPRLLEAIGGGVNAGVLTLRQGPEGPTAILHLGRCYVGRPIPPWEVEPLP